MSRELVKADIDTLLGTSAPGAGYGDQVARAQIAAAATIVVLSAGTGAAVQNGTNIQSALSSATRVIVARAGGGVAYVDDTLILGSDIDFIVAPGTTLKQYNASRHKALLRTGNVELNGTHTLAVVALCHETRAESGTGTIRYVKSGATKTMSYKAPGDSAYGSDVSVAGSSAKFELASNNGERLFIRTISAALPSSDGTYTQDVLVTAETGAEAVSVVRASGVCTVTQAGHRYRQGHIVNIVGNSAFDGLWVVTSSTSTTYTYVDARADEASAAALAYAIFNVSIEGKLEGGESSSNIGIHTNNNLFLNVNGLTLRTNVKTYTGNKYAGFLQACSVVRGYDNVFDCASDGYTSVGPMNDVEWENSRGYCHDNMFGVGTTNSDNILIHAPSDAGNRDQVDIRFNGVYPQECEQEPIRLFGSAGASHKNIQIRHVIGKSTTTATAIVWVFPDTMTLSATAGYVDGLLVEDCAFDGKDGVLFSPVQIQNASQTVKDLTVRRVRFTRNSAGVTMGYNPALVNVFSSAILNGVTLIEDCIMVDNTASGTAAAFLNIQTGTTIGGRIILKGNTATNAVAGFLRIQSSVTGAGSTTAFLIANSVIGGGSLFSLGSALGYISIDGATGSSFAAMGYVTATSGNVRISARGLDMSTGNINALSITGVGVTVTVDSSEVRADITKLARRDGAMVYNSNAAADNGTDGACGTGLFASIGTSSGSWKRVGTTGGAGNQY